MDNGFYPKSLQDCWSQPSNAKNWHGPYLDKLPDGSVGQSLRLLFSRQTQPNRYDLLSVGPDGKEGTDDDIGNWTK